MQDFIRRCRWKLKSNLFWVSLQPNHLADLSRVGYSFEQALKYMKEGLKGQKWIFPTLQANMRNQVNIANIKVEQGNSGLDMQSSIEKLKSGTSLPFDISLEIAPNLPSL